MQNPLILDGRVVAAEVEANLAKRVQAIIAQTHKSPVLSTILVGDNPSSVTYVRMKGNACRRVGMESLKIELPCDITTAGLIAKIEELNQNADVCGILLQHPVPPQIDEQACFNTIALEKDVDGVNTAGFGRMSMGLPAFASATPLAIMELLSHYKIPLEGREAVIVGRSPILGKPVAMLLLNRNATITVCHSRTQNLPEIIRRAEIVVAAIGKPRFIQADWIRDGAVLVDAGYNAGNVGDIDLENAIAKSSAYTPVPGGVGPVTIAMLMQQTVQSAEQLLTR
ncbi:MAG: tetrahydrofolate dehydrogenase/cyclohydrolase catalytic domain-containing protein [Eubacteriales bacterium]